MDRLTPIVESLSSRHLGSTDYSQVCASSRAPFHQARGAHAASRLLGNGL